MRNRELILNKMDNLESKVNKLNFMVNRQTPVEEFTKTLSETMDLIEELKSFVHTQPFSPEEINKL